MVTADELRKKYLDFFVSKGHAVIPSASLIPENDPTVLFTTAGMHPLVPFLLGEPHPAGKRLVNYQRCIRTSDIDLVGDDTHLTFFEMLGNWSLGDYWKKEAIEWSWEFLTDKKWLGLDPKRIYVTCFAGDENAPRDDESADIWKQQKNFDKDHIEFLSKEDNWWGPAGQTGPCGPDTEMFYQLDTGERVEIWNDVFMQYNKTVDGKYEPLEQKNVDTGMGVERTLAVLNNVKSVFETDVFVTLLKLISDNAKKENKTRSRFLADHIKAAVFLIADGVVPLNKDKGSILRRLIRKAAWESRQLELDPSTFSRLIQETISLYQGAYVNLNNAKEILDTIALEMQKAIKAFEGGSKAFEKQLSVLKQNPQNAAKEIFDAYQTFGLEPEFAFDIVRRLKIINESWEDFIKKYQSLFEKHQDISRKGAEQKFKGGLADHSEVVVRMHTATHLLHQALKDVLGNHVAQKGSNITAERLRFDFTLPQKMTPEELKKVEDIVNEKITEAIPVEKKVLPIEEARKLGATGLFGEKYGDTVSVYAIGDYSKEFCGGPHVTNTKNIGHFTIKKEEAVSAGIRRIKATVK